MRPDRPLCIYALSAILCSSTLPAQVTQISSLDIHQTVQQQGEPRAGKSADNNQMTLAGKVYGDGLGTIAQSKLVLDLGGNGVKFTATVGIDDEVGKGRGGAVFKVLGDKDAVLWQSPLMRAGDPPVRADVPLKGHKTMTMLVESKEDHVANHADWADAEVELHSEKYKNLRPNTVPIFEEAAEILTPKPGPTPRITGAKVFGVRPGRPVLYTITATGERPMTFSVDALPDGLQVDARTGRISGKLDQKGEYSMTVRAKNSAGEAARSFKIICGDTIGLVPAMGWNSWNCFGETTTAQNIRDATAAMVSSGLIDHGWSYINIDEGWLRSPDSKDPLLEPPTRDANGRILPNGRFPDMKGLVDYIHDKGLRAGIYSSPGPLTCGGFEGSYKHELQDAQTYAGWGFDYLKYDVCSYNLIFAEESNPGPNNNLEKPLDKSSPEHRAVLQKPWRVMREALDTLDRDLIYSISGNVRDWGTEVGANSWRVSSDVVDSWLEIVSGWRIPVSEIAFDRFLESERKGFSGPELAGPGHFNDRDMLVVGQVGWSGKQHPTRLTPNEQYTHISMWCLLASPLMIGCDMTKLDDFTLGLLTNDEVLEVNQDPLGKQAVRVAKDGDREVWAKDMEDGSKAVGLFNRGYLPTKVEIPWKTLGIAGPQTVRDLWRQKDLGVFDSAFGAEVPRHGVVLVKVMPAQTSTLRNPKTAPK